MRLTTKLLGHLHRVFNKDPQQYLALRITSDAGQLTWSVDDGFLTLTPSGPTIAAPLYLDLSQYTLQSLAVFLSGQLGYVIVYQDVSENQFLSALTLLDGSGDVQQSNGDHLYAYTNLIYAYLNANATELELAQSQIVNMIEQMSTLSAQDEFLDLLGTYYDCPREPGELDPSYGPRIIASILLPSSNNVGMALALEARFPGSSVVVPDAITNLIDLLTYNGVVVFNGAVLYNSGASAISNGFFDVEFAYDFSVGLPYLQYVPIIIAAINKNLRAGGTYIRNLLIQNGASANVLITSYTVGEITVFVYDQGIVFTDAPQDVWNAFDDESDLEWLPMIDSQEVGPDAVTRHRDDPFPWFDDDSNDDFSDALTQMPDLGAPAVGLAGAALDVLTAPATLTTTATGTFKFKPGNFALSNNLNGSPSPNGNGSNAAEIATFGAHGKPACQGYRAVYDWAKLESVQNTYNFAGIIADFNALQAASPGATFGVHFTARALFTPGLTLAQAIVKVLTSGIPGWLLNCGGSATIRNAYGSGSSTTYTLARQQNGQYGFSFSGWNGTTYSMAVPAFWDPAVAQGFANLGEALAQTSFLTTAGPFAGQTFTFNTHPLIEAVCDANDYAVKVDGTQGGFNPPAQTSSSNAPTAENYWTNSLAYWTAWQTAFAKTCVEVLYSFGFSGSDADTPTSFAARFSSLSAVAGLTFASTDTYGTDFNYSDPSASYGQQAYFGVTTPASGAGTVLPPLSIGPTMDSGTVTLDSGTVTMDGSSPANLPLPGALANQMPSTSIVQAQDYGINLNIGVAANSAAAVNGIIAAAAQIQSHKVVWCMFDSAAVSTSWAAYIYPTFTGSAVQPNITRPALLP